MYEYTCPQCKTAVQTKTLRSGATVPCLNCKRQLRVQVPEDEDEAPRRSGGIPPFLLIGCSGFLGILLGGSLLAVAFLFITPARRVTSQPAARFAGVITRKMEKDGEDKVVKKDKPDAPPAEAMTKEEVYKRLVKSCVWIIVTGDDGKSIYHGSGCLIDVEKRLVLTNEHVASVSAKKIEVLFPEWKGNQLQTENSYYVRVWKNGHATKATLVSYNTRRDLALLRLDKLGENAVPVKLSYRGVNPNQAISTIGGNPRGNQGQWIASNGDVRQIALNDWRYSDGVSRSAMVISSNVPINQGDSGGPVVNNRCTLVGLNALGAAGNSNSGHIDHSEICDFLRAYYKSIGENWQPPTDDGPNAALAAGVEKILKGLEAPQTEDRIKAIKQLGSAGPDARVAIPDLLKLLRNPNEVEKVRDESYQALMDIGAPAHDHAPLLLEAGTDKECLQARRYAARSLGFIPVEKCREVVPALVKALADEDREVRRNACDSLGRVGEPARGDAFTDLVKLLRDEHQPIRFAAWKALMSIKAPRDANPEDFRKLLADKEAPREAQIYSIWFLSDKGEAGGNAISEAIAKDVDGGVASEACMALGEVEKPTRELADALSRALDHKVPSVRMEAVRVIIKHDLRSPILPAYIKAISCRDQTVFKMALAKLPDDIKKHPLNITREALASLELAMLSDSAPVRMFTAFALEELAAEAASAAGKLSEAYLKERSADIQRKMLMALAAMGPDAEKELGSQAEKLLDKLKETALDTRTDKNARLMQTLAAIAVASVAPKSEQARAVMPVLAKQLYLKGCGEGAMAQPFFPSPRKGKPKVDTDDQEMHEWAKKALVKGGEAGARAIHDVFRQSFMHRPGLPPAGDTVEVQEEKRQARKAAFQLLARIGPVTDEKLQKDLNSLVVMIIGNGRKQLEFPDVLDAAREASNALKGKK